MTGKYLVRRFVELEDVETIDQTIAVVEAPDEWSVEKLIHAAYDKARMKPKTNDRHTVHKLEGEVNVEPEQLQR